MIFFSLLILCASKAALFSACKSFESQAKTTLKIHTTYQKIKKIPTENTPLVCQFPSFFVSATDKEEVTWPSHQRCSGEMRKARGVVWVHINIHWPLLNKDILWCFLACLLTFQNSMIILDGQKNRNTQWEVKTTRVPIDKKLCKCKISLFVNSWAHFFF